jgi:Lrp/AsnC family transcriptional regulator
LSESREGLAIFVPRGSPVHGFEDLRGRKIATGRGSIGHQLILAALESRGWSSSDVQIVFLAPSDAKGAYAQGSVDRWSTWEPYVSQEEVLFQSRRPITAEGLVPGIGFQVASTNAIRDKRTELEDFLHRLTAARAWSLTNVSALRRDLGQADEHPARRAAQLVGMRPFRKKGSKMADITVSLLETPRRIDAIDRKILRVLQEDASLSVAEIGERVGLSSTPCWKRIQRMEGEGIITGKVALVDQNRIGLGLSVFVSVESGDHSDAWLKKFAVAVSAMPEVMEFYRMAGDVDYMLRVVVADMQSYDIFYKKLIGAVALKNVTSRFAMEKIKSVTALPVPAFQAA